VDLLTGSQGNNLYTLSLGDMMASSPICLLLKASKTKSWQWHRHLSHLNFGAINHLARHGLVRGLPKLKFKKDHLCSACAIGKSKKKPYKPKSEDTNQEKLYLLHMDLCGLMRVTSVNEKKYILVIVDDYSRFTWVKCLRSKYEASEAVATACYTQNQSIIRLHHGEFEQPKADIGIFIGYAPTKKAFRIYNRCTRRIIETIHVDFDELIVMASECSSLEPTLHEMTLATISSGLVPNPHTSTPFVPPLRANWDILFQLMFDELHNPLLSVDHPASKVIALIDEVVAPELAESTGSPSFTTIDPYAPSASNSQTLPETQSPVISNDVEEENHDLNVAYMNNDPFFGISSPENIFEASSSSNVIPNVVYTAAPNSEHVNKWTKDHPLDNIIVEPKTYKDTLTQACWIEAMQEELNEFERLDVWELIPHLDKVMVITLEWIHKVKLDELEGFMKNKARLVARSYRQEEGIDFEESFAPEFFKGTMDPTLFIKRQGKDILLVQINVDDIIFASTTPELCDQFSKIMCSKFKMSMMGKISFFLRLQSSQSPGSIFLNQSKYALESLKKYGMESSDPVDTPMMEKSKLDKDP
nr:integrase, catalytic region, zinc finger, CCHC-type, peptidase aspartic, catalytic [Tanacetum cinerariifolium]